MECEGGGMRVVWCEVLWSVKVVWSTRMVWG